MRSFSPTALACCLLVSCGSTWQGNSSALNIAEPCSEHSEQIPISDRSDFPEHGGTQSSAKRLATQATGRSGCWAPQTPKQATSLLESGLRGYWIPLSKMLPPVLGHFLPEFALSSSGEVLAIPAVVVRSPDPKVGDLSLHYLPVLTRSGFYFCYIVGSTGPYNMRLGTIISRYR